MKSIAVILFFSVAVLIDAANKLPSITSSCGEYIPGSFPELLGPIFEKLKSILPDCAQGYVQTMIMYMGDVDEAFKCSDTRALSIWFKIYPTMFSMVLPFVDDDSIRDVITNGVCDSKALLAQLSKGNLDLKSMQDFFGKVSTAMNDSLNNYCPPKPCLPPRRPLLGL